MSTVTVADIEAIAAIIEREALPAKMVLIRDPETARLMRQLIKELREVSE